MRAKRLGRLSLAKQNVLAGYVFATPFILGFLFVFLLPLVQSLTFSLSQLNVTRSGYELKYVGLENFRYILRVHPTFVRELVETMVYMITNVFWILVFSFFAAIILNQKFRGRLLARTILFLPIVMSSGIILRMEIQDYLAGILEYGLEEANRFLATQSFSAYLANFQLPRAFIDNILLAIDRIPEIIRSSGIQILVLLAGLQGIPSSLYEAAEVEGATGWECFWLITLPLLSPLILTNIVYTIVDCFTAPTNVVVTSIRNASFGSLGYGVGSAMSWLYFCLIGVMLVITFAATSRLVFYHE